MKKNNLGFILAGLMFALLQMSFVFASLAMAEEISLPVEFVNEISDVRFYDSWYLDPDYTTANGRIGDVHGNTEKSLENGQVLAFRTIRKAHRDYRHPSSIYQQFPLPPPSIEPYLSGGADYVDLNGDGQKDLLRSYSFNSQDGANINRAIVASHFMKKHAPTIAGFNLSANAERAARKLLHFVAIQNWNAWFIRSNEWVNQLIDLRSRGIVACSSM